MERMLIESPADLPALELLYECRSLPEACQWLYQYLSHTQDVIQDALQTRHHSILERCIERMELEFDPDLSLSVVADWCHFSPSYFSKLFKEHTGESFTDYLVALRMTKAAAKLKNSHKKVYEIAEEVGYRDVKYFTHLQKVYGVAPNEYRTMGPPPPLPAVDRFLQILGRIPFVLKLFADLDCAALNLGCSNLVVLSDNV